MARIIDFDNSVAYRMKRAEELYDIGDIAEALATLLDVLKQQPKNLEARMLAARIYVEMNQPDLSNEYYFSILAEGPNAEAVKGVIANLLCQGKFKDARYYGEKYNIDFDFSDYLTVQTPEGDIIYGGDDEEEDEAAEIRSRFKLVVSKKTKDGENLVDKKRLKNMTVADLNALPDGQNLFNFGELMEKLMSIDDAEEELPSETPVREKIGFKQVYPPTQTDCEGIISRALNLFSAGKAEDAVALLNTVTEKNGRYYYIAQKNKVMCYLSLNRLVSMRGAAEEALKGLPNDFTLLCYHYISLKLLEENAEAEIALEKVRQGKPNGVIERMVKIDVCRLALDHEGVIECADKVLEEFPYQAPFLMLKGKAQYNAGHEKAARATFLSVLKTYPDNYEAKMMLERLSSGEDGLISYGEIELAIRRVKLLGELKGMFSISHGFLDYLKNDKDAIANVEFLLLNESDKNVYALLSNLRYYIPGPVEELFKKLLLKHNASDYLKLSILTNYIFGYYPKSVAVVRGRRLRVVKLPAVAWEKGLPDSMTLAAAMTFADFVFNEDEPEKAVNSLAHILVTVGDYLWAESSDRETVRNLLDINDVLALKRALTDITLRKPKRTRAMTVQDELYLTAVNLLEKIEDDYEI